MPKRSEIWDKIRTSQIRNSEFATDFVNSEIKESGSLHNSLANAIRMYGIREFSHSLKINESNLTRSLHSDYNPTLLTVQKWLDVLGLELMVKEK